MIIDKLNNLAAGIEYSQQFGIDGIQLTLQSVEPSLVGWVMKYLQPVSLNVDASSKKQTSCICLYSDELLLEALAELHRPGVTTFEVKGKNVGMLICSKLTSSLALYYCGTEGMFWVIDASHSRVFVVYSSRTNQPALEFARTVRTIVVCHLESRGWVKYHAGAVRTVEGVVMIIGDSGAGKTSLIVDLVAGGADYIANEVLLVKQSADDFYAIGYPMAIAVGIGTAMQFEHLAKLVESPDPLMYPRHRFSKRRVTQTPRLLRHQLDDKLQLLPEELIRYLHAGGMATGGKIQSLLVPSVSKVSIKSSVKPLEYDSLQEILYNNFMGLTYDRSHPIFREHDQRTKKIIDEQAHSIDALANLQNASFDYYLNPERETKKHLNMLRNYVLKCQYQENVTV